MDSLKRKSVVDERDQAPIVKKAREKVQVSPTQVRRSSRIQAMEKDIKGKKAWMVERLEVIKD